MDNARSLKEPTNDPEVRLHALGFVYHVKEFATYNKRNRNVLAAGSAEALNGTRPQLQDFAYVVCVQKIHAQKRALLRVA